MFYSIKKLASGITGIYDTVLICFFVLGKDGELPVLPLSVYGALAMAHSEASEEYSSPYQFFFYLYDKRSAGLGGISFDEGQFSVFGYTTTGRDILPQIKTGDVIRSAKLIEGQDRLVLPKES